MLAHRRAQNLKKTTPEANANTKKRPKSEQKEARGQRSHREEHNTTQQKPNAKKNNNTKHYTHTHR